jgi:PKD repeat protein
MTVWLPKICITYFIRNKKLDTIGYVGAFLSKRRPIKRGKVPIMSRKCNKYPIVISYILFYAFISFTFLFLSIINSSAATQVAMEWTPNTEPDLAGYRVFCREQSQYYDFANPSWEGTVPYCTIYDLDETKAYCFVVRAFDTEEFESGNSNEVCQETLVIFNQPPIADAGPDQTVNEGKVVLLNGSNSTDLDDGIKSYHWGQIGGPAVDLSDPDVKQPTFITPEVTAGSAALTFELTVLDYDGNKRKDRCIVNVTRQNEPPQANAGTDQTVDEGVVITLDGSSSIDIDDGIVSYQWTQIGVPAVTLSNQESSQPTFTAPNVGPDGVSLNFNLTVTDVGGLQSTDTCIVNISWQNKPPRAVVSPDYKETTDGTLVTLDGSGSTDSDDGIASYLWSQAEGDPISFSDPTSAVTTFTAPKTEPNGKNIKLKLTIKDHGGLQGAADSIVYITMKEPANTPPTADFDVGVSKKKVSFIDSSSDTDGAISTWFWDFGDGQTSDEQNPIHRYVKFGNYPVTLTVTDDKGASNSKSTNITVTN